HRVFYISPGYYPSWVIQAFDRDTFTPVSSVRLPQVAGNVVRLLRWGTNGLVFNTSEGQIWLVQSGILLPQYPRNDLSISQQVFPPSPLSGSNASYTLSISNAGPGTATFVQITNAIPANSVLLTMIPSSGIATQTAFGLSWIVPELGQGGTATLLFTIRHNGAGAHFNIAGLSSYEPDFNQSNNLSRLDTYVQPSIGQVPVGLNFPVEDILFDPDRDRLLLSITNSPGLGTNGIAIFNPNTGAVDSFIPLGRKPSKMIRSQDGRYLYVSFKEDALVRRIYLSNFMMSLEFPIGSESPYPLFAGDMVAVPGQPDSLVVARVRLSGPLAQEYPYGLGIYDNGILRSNIAGGHAWWSLASDPLSGRVYACSGETLVECVLSSFGVDFSQSLPLGFKFGNTLKSTPGKLFSNSGRVVELPTLSAAGICSGINASPAFEADPISGRVFYIVSSAGTWSIKAFSASNFMPFGSLNVSNLVGNPSALTRWGSNGLAFKTSGNQLFLCRGPFVSAGQNADLRVSQTFQNGPFTPGSNFNCTVSIQNNGPDVASSLRLTNALSPGVAIVATTCSVGLCSTSGGKILWSLPELAVGSNATVVVTLRMSSLGLLTSTAALSADSSDPRLADNTSVVTAQIGSNSILDAVISLSLPTSDLMYDPETSRIYATIPPQIPNLGGGLVSINPLDPQVEWVSDIGPGGGRMALSSNNKKLYVTLDYGIQTIEMPQGVRGLRFPLDPAGEPFVPEDLLVLPNSSSSLAVVIANGGFGGSPAIYDNGIMRSNIGAAQGDLYLESLVLGDDPTILYMQNQGAGGFRRYSIDAGGVTLLDSDTTILPMFTGFALKWGEGRIYTSLGIIMDPVARRQTGYIPGIPANSLVLYDAPSRRLFYIVANGSTTTLQSYDPQTLGLLGSLNIPGVSGSLSSLVRWGADGLAFRTTGDQLFLLRTSLLPSSPPADLQVSFKAITDPIMVGSNFSYSVFVTNRGQNNAANCKVSVKLPSNLTLLGVSSSQGTNIVSGQNVLVNLGAIPNGAIGSATFSVKVFTPGGLLTSASVFSSALDPDLANNFASVTNWAEARLDVNNTVQFNQPVRDILYDQARQVFYVSGGNQRITILDPQNLRELGEWPLPSEGGALALSSDTQFLYVGLDHDSKVGRLQTATGNLDRQYDIMSQGCSALAIRAVPNLAASIVVAAPSCVQVYDDGVPRPNKIVDSAGASYLDFAGDPSIVYANGYSLSGGRRFRTFEITSEGIREKAWIESLPTSLGAIKGEGNWMYADNGQIISLSSNAVLTQFTGLGAQTCGEPDFAAQRIFFLTKINNSWQLRAYDLQSYAFLGASTVTNILGIPRSLTRWGVDGLAFCTSSNQVFFMRSSLVPTNYLNFILTRPSAPLLAGADSRLLITLSNTSPFSASNVLVTGSFTLPYLSTIDSVSQGTRQQAADSFVWSLGSIASNQAATLAFVLHPTNTIDATLGCEFQVSGIANGSFPEMRTYSQILNLFADNDRDGLADTWELSNGLNPSDPLDALLDSDHDGANNWQEFLAGTDPRNGGAVFRVTRVRTLSNTVEITFSSILGKNYVLEFRDLLPGSAWEADPRTILGTGDQMSIAAGRPIGQSTRFYRIRLLSYVNQ
ncbi:MAG: Conserved repeat domain protein, partial [Verrucomicrobiales bacterium]|nr:Conserved repeat domain protein [Verrucomicrobiales bacterium]